MADHDTTARPVSKLEEIARALCALNCEQTCKGCPDWSHYIPAARAAVEAMREPSDAMTSAFHASCDEHGHVLWRYGYRAMIDAILSDHQPSPSTQQVQT